MKIEINPKSLLNLEHICEVLYKLHPSVLDYLVEMQRSLGNILGFIDLNNPSLEEREFLANISEKEDYSLPMEEDKIIDPKKYSSLTYEDKMELAMASNEDDKYKSHKFGRLLKYIQLDNNNNNANIYTG